LLLLFLLFEQTNESYIATSCLLRVENKQITVNKEEVNNSMQDARAQWQEKKTRDSTFPPSTICYMIGY